MNLEMQVCSLELSKKLKALGVKQDSLFYYQNNPYNDGQDCIDIMIKELSSENGENVIINTESENEYNPKYSAFTASELGEMLPISIYLKDKRKELIFFKHSKDHSVFYRNLKEVHYTDETFCCGEHDKTEANARAKMLIYLIENKLIEVV